jgi:hypothetical protein
MSGSHGKKKVPFWERAIQWLCFFGSILTILVAIPALPWRYAKVDTNMGNRFVMERYYYMTGATNNLGKTEGWMSLRRKVQRKSEEFGKPSPLVAIVGTVTQAVGAGGAAMGCPMWLVCKEHTSVRYSQYTTVAYCSIAFMVCTVLSALSAGACVVYLGFEQDAAKKQKKKKKKHDDDCMQAESKTMTAGVMAFLFSFIAICGFTVVTQTTLNLFKESAYYPYAGAHAAPFVGGFGTFLLFIVACTTTNRCFKCCGYKPEDAAPGGGEGEWGAPPPGYGAPPGAYGAPPGAYGAPPGAYGAPPGYGPPPGGPGGYGAPPGGGQW